MPISSPDQFITVTSLGTMAGASAATFVVTNALKMAFNLAPKWLGLLIAQLICVGLAIMSNASGSDYVIAVLNGGLVFLSAAGASGVSGSAARATERGDEPGRGDVAPLRRRFFSSWF